MRYTMVVPIIVLVIGIEFVGTSGGHHSIFHSSLREVSPHVAILDIM
jgi:hypothetical protein